MITCLTNILRKATENAIFDATDYQIPVTQLKRVQEGWRYAYL